MFILLLVLIFLRAPYSDELEKLESEIIRIQYKTYSGGSVVSRQWGELILRAIRFCMLLTDQRLHLQRLISMEALFCFPNCKLEKVINVELLLSVK